MTSHKSHFQSLPPHKKTHPQGLCSQLDPNNLHVGDYEEIRGDYHSPVKDFNAKIKSSDLQIPVHLPISKDFSLFI